MRGMRFDTMIAAYLLGESNMSIQTLAFDRLKMKIPLLIDIIGQAGKKQLTMSADRDRRRVRLLLPAGRRAAAGGGRRSRAS